MHIFDIRRSNSVTELWKRYEINTSESSQAADKDDASFTQPAMAATHGPADDQPLLAAFEAELANMLHHTEDPPEAQPEQPNADRSTADERRTPHPAEVLAAQILHHLVHGATLVQSELRLRWPELQRHLREAQRSVPENVIPSLQSMLATIEAHMRTAYNNIPDSGRQWAENTYQAGRPMAENATDNFRTVASELNEIGRTLFAAFESEFGRLNSSNFNTAADTTSQTSTYSSNDATYGATGAHSTSGSEHQGSNKDTQDTKSEAPDANRHTASNSTDGNSAPAYHSTGHNLPTQPSVSCPPRRGPSHPFSRPYPMPGPPPPPYVHNHHSVQPPNYLPPYVRMNGASSAPFGSTSPLFPSNPWVPRNFHHAPPHPPHWANNIRWPRAPAPPSYSSTPYGNPTWSEAHSQEDRNEIGAPNQSPEETHSGNKTLFMGNIGFRVTEKVIKEVFASRGFIVTVDLPTDAVSGKHAGFGYLQFPSSHAAMAALQALQGAHIDGHAINLEFSHATPTSGNAHEEAGPQAPDPSLSQAQSLHGTSKVSEQSSPETTSNKTASMKRRKSVTFREPARSHEDSILTRTETSKTEPDLIDLTSSSNEVTNTAAPLPRPFTIGGLDDLPNLNPEAQMSRFPPVSQFEAQVVANHQQRRSSGAGSGPPSGQQEKTLPADAQKTVPSKQPSPLVENHIQRSQTTKLPLRSRNHHETDLRRARSTALQNRSRSDNLTRRGSESSPIPEDWISNIHRRISEHVQPSPSPSSTLDTWARLDKRERSRSRPRSLQSIPGSYPTDEQPEPTASALNGKDDEIESCVNSLIDMGYGTVEDGGRSRMAVYAAASNGVLLDAIEMIEDERKAYARSSYQ